MVFYTGVSEASFTSNITRGPTCRSTVYQLTCTERNIHDDWCIHDSWIDCHVFDVPLPQAYCDRVRVAVHQSDCVSTLTINASELEGFSYIWCNEQMIPVNVSVDSKCLRML
jgi:hypothetical protein